MESGVAERPARPEPTVTPTVLHVDDDPVLLELTRGILQREGVQVASESDPLAVPERLEGGTVTALVSDYEMPTMDGEALFQRVRRDHPSLPFVLFTGKEREELPLAFRSTDAAWYVQKRGAGGYDRLVDVLRAVLNDGRAEVSAAESVD